MSRIVVKDGRKVVPEHGAVGLKVKKTLELPVDVAAQLKSYVAQEMLAGRRVNETEVIVAALKHWLN